MAWKINKELKIPVYQFTQGTAVRTLIELKNKQGKSKLFSVELEADSKKFKMKKIKE